MNVRISCRRCGTEGVGTASLEAQGMGVGYGRVW